MPKDGISTTSAMHSAPSLCGPLSDRHEPRERERESMVQIEGCVSSDMGVTFSDVTPMYLYNKQFTVDSVSTRNKGWLWNGQSIEPSGMP